MNKFLRKSFLFHDEIEITTPLAYEKNAESENSCVFLHKDKKGLVINSVTKDNNNPGEILALLYKRCRETKKDVSEPVYRKRIKNNTRQHMVRFSWDGRQVMLVSICVDEKIYIIEFTFDGYGVDNWVSECEKIINTIRIKKGEKKYGDKIV